MGLRRLVSHKVVVEGGDARHINAYDRSPASRKLYAPVTPCVIGKLRRVNIPLAIIAFVHKILIKGMLATHPRDDPTLEDIPWPLGVFYLNRTIFDTMGLIRSNFTCVALIPRLRVSIKPETIVYLCPLSMERDVGILLPARNSRDSILIIIANATNGTVIPASKGIACSFWDS